MFGGSFNDEIQSSNIRINSQRGDIVELKPMIEPCEKFGSTSFKNSNEDFLIAAGGIKNFGISKNVQIYSVETDSWKTGPKLEEAIFNNELVSCYDSVMMIGGQNYSKKFKTVQFLDYERQKWLTYKETNHPYFSFGATFHNNCVYVCNGRNFEVYHKDEDAWMKLEAPSEEIQEGIRLICFNDQILAIGGYSNEHIREYSTSVVSLYDPRNEEWERLPDMPERLSHHRLFIIKN